MVAGTPDSTVQHPHASSSTPVPSAEEEALKRNTDCVYFLASPLTCKKGAECEYRHSDYARVNPRDCWYWLNGNCLNPKCAFRHPPLDGLLGTQATTASVAGPVAPPQVAVQVAPPLPTYNAGKQVVPCIFFQKGYCMKGDRCAFSHGTNPVGNKVQQTPAQTLPGELPSLKKPAGGLERCSQEQKIAPTLSKPTALQLAPKLVPEAEKNLPVNVGRIDRNAPLARSTDEEASQYKHLNSSAVKGSLQTRPGRSHQAHALDDHNFQHDKENEELMRESSPGFDVLVDDELGDADYYHGEDHQYGRTRTHEQYEMDHLTDYNSLSDIDRRDSRGYDRMIGWDQRRNSSERMLAYPEGRSYRKSESPDHIDESDLRHRLSKQRRVNGLRSVVSNDFASESLVDDQMYHSSSRQRLPSQEGSLGGRLKGRIKFPGRSTVNGSDGHQQHRDRDMDRGRSQGRSYQDRPRDNNSRLKGRVQEHFTSEERSVSGPRMRREFLDGNSGEFAGPKRLAELKSSNREPQVRGQGALGKQQTPISFADQQAETDVSFEGPKPLSVLLKRKREVVTAATEESRPEYDSDSLITSGKDAAGKVELHGSSSPSKEEEEKAERAPDHVNQSEKEDGMMVEVEEGAVDEHEIEGDYQRDGDYEYEQVDEEGEYNYDGENADEEEYIDDEEGDDFAKKVGVMFS